MEFKAHCNQRPATPFRWFSTKTWLIVTFTSFFLLTACLSVSARGLSQTVTFSGKDVPLEKVFSVIKDQTGYVVFCNANTLLGLKPITVSASNVELDMFLRLVLADQPLEYVFKSKTIFINRTSQEKITLSEKNATLETVLLKIEDQTGYQYVFRAVKAKDTKVTIEVKDVTLQEALGLCFVGQPFTWVIDGKTILVKEKEILRPAPTVKVQGIVLTESGQPLAGANVTVKETGRGTITNAKGEFELLDVPVNNTLIISFIGYSSQQLKVKDATKVQIYLKVAKNELDKVVIQAYGTTTQRLNTGILLL
jgi:hypothetical protein